MSTPYEEIIKGMDSGKQQSPYTAVIQKLATQARQETALKDSGNQAVKQVPDRAAEVDTLSKATGLPADLVDRNLDLIKERSKVQSTPYGDIVRDTPRLAGWLANPQNAAMTQDDLPHMGYLESVLTKTADYARAGLSGLLLGTGTAVQGAGQISDALDRRLMDTFDTSAALDRFKPGYGKDRQGFTRLPPFPGAFPDDRKALPSQTAPAPPWWAVSSVLQTAGKAIGEAGKYVAPPPERQGFGTEVVSGLGQFVPLIAANLLAGPEASIAMFAGQGAQGMNESVSKDAADPQLPAVPGMLQKGNIANLFHRPQIKNSDGSVSTTISKSFNFDGKEILIPTVVDGKHLSDDEAVAHFRKTGEHLGVFDTPENAYAYANALTKLQGEAIGRQETPQYKKDIATLAGAGIAVGTGEFGLNTLLKRVPFPIKNAIVSKLVDTLAAGGIQAAQAASQSLLNDVTRHVLTNPQAPIGEGLGRTVGSQAATGAVARLLLTTVLGAQMQTHFKERQDNLKEATAAVTSSKLFERNPAALRDFIAEHGKDSETEHVLLPSDKFKEYFQSKGVDPEQAAAELMQGGVEAYRESVVTGADLRVPFADYETKLAPEHGKFFDEELRFTPGEMNFREAQEYLAREGQKLDTEEKAAKPDAAIEASGEKIKQDIIGQISGHYDPIAADSNAESVAAVFKTLGQRMGVDPFELYSKYNLGVKFPVPDILKSKTAVDAMDTMIERIRAGDIPSGSEVFGSSLVEFLRKNGGVQDHGGEIAKMEPDVATDKKSKRALKKNPLVSESGLVLHNAVEKAVDDGYLPEGSSENDLIDAIDRELRGDPVYSQQRIDTPEAERASVLMQLDQYIRDRGIDLKAMSNEQVKKLMEEAATLEKSGNGLEFFQALFHGSPHDFDKFSIDKIGTGEGAQAYGHGLYFAENPRVAEEYQRRLSTYSSTARYVVNGKELAMNSPERHAAGLLVNGDLREVRRTTKRWLSEMKDNPGMADTAKQSGLSTEEYWNRLNDFAQTHGRRDVMVERGRLYKVEIPDEHTDTFIDYDEPLAKQNDKVKDVVREILKKEGYLRPDDDGPRQLVQAWLTYKSDNLGMGAGDTGGSIYDLVVSQFRQKKILAEQVGGGYEVTVNDPAKASAFLSERGIKGMRFLDEQSRDINKRNKTRNVVVFDDSIINLTHKDGTPVTPAERKEFLQADNRGDRRGSLLFNADGSFNINLFAKRNLSTFLHETGHFYLEVFGDLVDELKALDPASLTPTQQTMVSDYEKALKWLGVEDRKGVGEDQHEQWARGIEAYFREGKAPSVELRSIFARFRSWLIDLYRNVRSLNVEMNPEIREVMDRLFATDQEIEAAQHEAEIKSLFMTQEESGLDNEGWQAYQTKLQRASDEAKNALQSKLMKEFSRQREQWWLSEESKLRDEIQAQVYKQPEYVALSVLRKGELPDGSESPLKVKLDLNLIKERYGKNTTTTDTLRRLGVARLEDGIDPDTAARQFGYDSGDALVEALVNARPMKELIEAEVHDEMIRRHGDMQLDGSIHDEARAAVLGKYRDEVVREEMRTLRRLQEAGKPAQEAEANRQMKEREYERRWLEAESKMNVAIAEGRKQAEIDSLRAEMKKIKADQKADAAGFVVSLRKGDGIPTAQQITRFAEDRLRTTVIANVVPGRYWAAARNASREATAAAATGDYTKAFAAKGRELLNLELFRKATDLKEDFDKTRTSWLKMFRPDSKVATTRSMEYVNAARAIASKLLFPDKQARVLESMKALEKYDPDAYEDVQDAISSIVEDPRKLRDLTVEEFNGIRDIVASLWNRARTDNLILVEGKRVVRQSAQDELVANLQEHTQKAGNLGKNRTISEVEKVGVHGLSVAAALRRVESWVEAMDGGKDGPWRTYIWNPVKESINTYRLQKVDELTKYAEILKPIEKTLTRAAIAAPELNYTFKGGKAELLGAMLHSGNRESMMSNLSKLLRGRRDTNGIPWGTVREDGTLDTSKWDKMVSRMQKEGILTKADYDYMQGVWDLFEALKPGLQKSHFETKGFYFKEVPADAIETPWGTYRGGYVPAKADPFMSTAAAIRSDKQAMSETGNSYALPSAGLGNTKTRLAVAEPLSMNLAFIPGHIDWALRLTHIDPRVKDVSKMVFDRSFRNAVDAHNPAVVKDMLVPWLQRAATQRLEEVGKYKAIDSFARLLRTGSGIQSVAFSVTNGLQQATGLFLTATKVPPGKLLSSMFDYVGHPTRFADSIMEKSPFMRTFETNRAMEIQQDINNIVLDPNVYAKAQNFTRKHGQVLAGMTQGMVNLVSWQGAYDHAVESGRTEKQAIRDADSVIRNTQGSFFPEDISRAETGTPFVRSLTMFSSYFNMQANLMMTEVGNTIRSDRGAMYKAGRLTAVYALGFMLPAVGVQAIQNGLTGNWKEEDDSYMMGALKLFFGAQLRDATMMVPGIGGVLQAGVNSVLTNSTYDDDIRTTPWLQMTGKGIKDLGVWWHFDDGTTEEAKETGRKNLAKDALNIVGTFSKLPLGPLGKPLGFLMDLDAGKVKPKGAGDMLRGLVMGSIPKEQ